MKDIIEDIVSDVYEGKYNNHFDLEKKFRDDLEKKLKNEPNKIDFLNQLKGALILDGEKRIKKCNCGKSTCGHISMKDSSVKIIDAVIKELTDMKIELKESFFKKNIKYFYYTVGSIAFVYSFYKWIIYVHT